MEIPTSTSPRDILLDDNWRIQSSGKAGAAGEKISSTGHDTGGWYTAKVPSTIMGSLVANGVYNYEDLFMGENLTNVPASLFETSWWYRNSFVLPENADFTTALLEFDGVVFRANVWLNASMIASSTELYGTFNRFQFDVTEVLNRGGENVLAVEVFKADDKAGEYSLSFCDWAPPPPGRGTGLWREVRLRLVNDVSIGEPFVESRLDTQSFSEAGLVVTCKVRNHKDRKVIGTISGTIGDISFGREVTLDPRGTALVEFTPEEFPRLFVEKPRVWWPHDMGTQEMYSLSLDFWVQGAASDAVTVPFAVRDIRTVRQGDHDVLVLNGKKILVRGGGWTDQLFLEYDPENIEKQLQYVRHMNLNAIRLEGFWGNNHRLYDLCDRYGIMVVAGLNCEWEWAAGLTNRKQDPVYGCLLSEGEMDYAERHFRDQITWLRNHPCLVLWMFSSDLGVKPELEKRYLKLLREIDPGRPYLMNFVTGKENACPSFGIPSMYTYDYVPPAYWYQTDETYRLFGFCSETGPGPQVPPLESLKKMIPPGSLWPPDSAWDFHCGRGHYSTLARYNDALESRLGKPKDLDDYLRKVQLLNYESIRPMFEAFASRQYDTAGIIMWMLNAQWPKLYWQLYDYYLMPNGAFYGTRKACEPLHIQYDYGARKIEVVNKTRSTKRNLRAQIVAYNFGKETSRKYLEEIDIGQIGEDEVMIIRELPEAIPGTDGAYLLDLRLLDADGNAPSINQYLLSRMMDELGFEETGGTPWFYKAKRHADLNAINLLPTAKISWDASFGTDGDRQIVDLKLHNPGQVLAFNIDISILNGEEGESVKPIFLEDNFFSLLPGETRSVRAHYHDRDTRGRRPNIKVRPFNEC